MENYDQAHGLILYRTKLAAGAPALLRLTELHDYALVFLNGRKLGTLDRRYKQTTARVPERGGSNVLEVLVDTFGHVNYGPYIHDRKGITDKAELVTAGRTNELAGPGAWTVFNLPLDSRQLRRLKFKRGTDDGPAFYRATFDLKKAGDSFLDLRAWNKGLAWINGHNLGRFWNLGPSQTLYCPGPWLKPGRNELIVFDLNGSTNHSVAGLVRSIESPGSS